MKPIKTKTTNSTLSAPKGWDWNSHGGCKSLPVHHDVFHGLFYSYWKTTFWERVKILFGRPIRLCILSLKHPPIALEAAPRKEV